MVRLLEKTRVRVGNEEYARENRSFGLTTMRNRHAEVGTTRIRFRFRAKGGKEQEVELSDRRLARIVARCQELPGQALFTYLDEAGEQRTVDSSDVNLSPEDAAVLALLRKRLVDEEAKSGGR